MHKMMSAFHPPPALLPPSLRSCWQIGQTSKWLSWRDTPKETVSYLYLQLSESVQGQKQPKALPHLKQTHWLPRKSACRLNLAFLKCFSCHKKLSHNWLLIAALLELKAWNKCASPQPTSLHWEEKEKMGQVEKIYIVISVKTDKGL